MLHESARLHTRRKQFRILQLTDFHADVSEYENERTREDIRVLVERHRPDFLAVTGDIWCGDAHPTAAPMYLQRELVFLASLHTPWSFTWGNHDWCGDFKTPMQWIASTPHAVAPHGDGRGNFRIEIASGTTAPPAWDLFFLNSGLRWNLPHDLEWFMATSMRLKRERDQVVPAVAFFHIPLKNYQAAMDDGRAIGIANEKVLYWGDEEGLAAGILKKAGNIRACFCGHSHRNDFYFEEKGITFAYGRSSGYGGYGGEDVPKGAKLIELSMKTACVEFRTVFGRA